MNAVQVIGDADTVLAFALGGVAGVAVSTPEEARAALDAVADEVRRGGGPVRRPALVLVARTTARAIRAEVERMTLDPRGPMILEIPGVGDDAGGSEIGGFLERLLRVKP